MKTIVKYFFILFILGSTACDQKDNKNLEKNSLICEINSEELDESNGTHIFKCGSNKYKLEFNGVFNNEEALFGEGSIKLTQKYQYGTKLEIDNLSEGEFLEVSIWRKDKSHSAQLILAAKDHNFYVGEKFIYQKGVNDWEQLKIFFKVPKDIDKLIMYSFIGDAKIAYFDGLVVRRYAQTEYPKHEFNSEIKLIFSPKNMNLFDKKRSKSLDLGVNVNDGEWMEGIMAYENVMPIKARLKGDWLDHLIGAKWSFRIKLKEDYTFNRMKVFSIQHPKSRYYLYEYFSHQLFLKENLLTTRYGFANGSLNGSSLGMYAWEEHFTKQLIEYNLRREGPIVKFDENPMWLTVAHKKLNPINKWSNIFLPSFYASRILPFGKIVDSVAMKQFEISQMLMNQYKYRTGSISDCFDVEKFAQYWALIDLVRGYHSKAWHNQRFYYNPVLCKLEPINFDNFTDYFNPNHGSNLTYYLFKKTGPSNPEHNMEDSPFGDSTFLVHYLNSLKKYSSDSFVTKFTNSTNDSLIKYDTLLRKEFPAYSFDFDYLKRRAEFIKTQLPELKEYIDTKEYENYKLEDHDHKFNPINITQVIPAFLNTYFYKVGDEKMEMLFENFNSVKLNLIGITTKNKKSIYSFEKNVFLNKYYDKVVPLKIEVPELSKAEYIAFQMKDSSKILYSPITPWKKATGLSPYQKIKRDFNLSKSNLFEVRGDSLIIKSGKHIINQKVLIPSNKKVIIEAGVEIDIVAKGSFISHSPIFTLGTESKPILIHSSDSSANGFIVLQAKEKSILNYTVFKHLNTLNYNGWTLTGAVNFYESDVDLNSCQFLSNHCEDALNIVRSNFKVDRAEFYHIYADAFDSDFCTGELTNSIFKYVGNDAIDFSTSQITISDCEISEINDKGISGGEESTLIVFNTTITDCNIGAASKDLSNVELNNVSISNCNYGLVLLRKKPEYGPATIIANQLKIEDCMTEELIELNSILIREGKEKKGYQKNVAAMFY